MAGWMAEHRKARMLCPPGPCEKCGAEKSEVHHKNEDWRDHRLENLQRLCRSCHIKAHRSGRRCLICESPHKGLGYCDKHYQRLKTHGDPMKLGWPTKLKCLQPECQLMSHAHGLCSKHAQQKRRGTLGLPQMTRSERAIKQWQEGRFR